MILSAIVCPGIGQLLQRRWIAAFTYCGLFVTAFVIVLTVMMRILLTYYSLGLDPDAVGDAPDMLGPLAKAFLWLLIAILVYIANLFDAYHGYCAACTRWAAKKAGVSPPSSLPDGGRG